MDESKGQIIRFTEQQIVLLCAFLPKPTNETKQCGEQKSVWSSREIGIINESRFLPLSQFQMTAFSATLQSNHIYLESIFRTRINLENVIETTASC